MQSPMTLMTIFASAGALALAGCSQPVIVYEPVHQQLYADGDFESATLTGELRTEVFGTVSARGGSGDQLTAATTTAMRGANRGKDVVFTPNPTGGGSGAYHVVMLFNPQRGVVAADICTGADKLGAKPANGPVKLLSSFCFHDTLLATAGGRISGAQATDDPVFHALIKQVTLSLFPAYDQIDIGGEPPRSS